MRRSMLLTALATMLLGTCLWTLDAWARAGGSRSSGSRGSRSFSAPLNPGSSPSSPSRQAVPPSSFQRSGPQRSGWMGGLMGGIGGFLLGGLLGSMLFGGMGHGLFGGIGLIEILLIAGDDSHKLSYADITPALAATRGIKGGLVPGRKGDPDDDDAWFVTDWMDTTRAQEALQFQHYSWQAMLDEASRNAGPSKYVLPLLSPLIRAALKRRGAYWKQPGRYADPWGAIKRRLGDPAPDA